MFPLSPKGTPMTVRYELLMLAAPEITKDETADLEKQLDQYVKKADATTISFERWGKYRLSFAVNKNDYGVYFLARFEGETAKMKDLLASLESLLKFKLNMIVLRYMITRLPDQGSIEYQRPESLEEAPPAEVENFGRRNNRMDNNQSSDRPQRNERFAPQNNDDEDVLESTDDSEMLEA